MIALDTLPEAVRQHVLEQDAELARRAQLIKLLEAEIQLLNLRCFGPKSEKLSPAQTALLWAEPGLTTAEVHKEADRPESEKTAPLPRAKTPRRRNPGREKLPDHLERRVVTIPCHPQGQAVRRVHH